jgi:hypothetical protein
MLKTKAALCSTDPPQMTYRYHVQYLNTRMATEHTQMKLKKSQSRVTVHKKIMFQYKLHFLKSNVRFVMLCLGVDVYCTTATGCQPNCSFIYHIIS